MSVNLVTFGEVMLRLAPAGFMRVRQSIPGSLDATFGGGELNVAVSFAVQGGNSSFLTASPDNAITDCLVQDMQKLGVDASLVQRTQHGRFGIYFVETGANQRGSTVTYDRDGSAIAVAQPDDFDFESAFADKQWLHITGITPAISESGAACAFAAVKQARAAGLTVSCDLNFRRKLWRWKAGVEPRELALQTMRTLVQDVDVVIANEEDADLTLGISAAETDVESGELNVTGYESVAREIVKQFSNVSKVAITLRESLSATHNNWGALLFDAKTDAAHFAPLINGEYRPYEIRSIVDRVGAGDSFAGGLIFALTTPELSAPKTAIQYATAASCLKHSIKGDFNYSTRGEIEVLMGGAASGRVQR